MAQLGAEKVAGNFVVKREALIVQLESIRDGPAYAAEVRRRQKVLEKLTARRGSEIRIRVSREDVFRKTMPAGVSFSSNQMTVDFRDFEELLTRLYQVSSAMANDFESIKAFVEELPARKQV
jgi:hypothetical protein